MRGIVLAGGKSQRFGQDKALTLINGMTLLERMTRLLEQLGFETAVIADPSKDYSFLRFPVHHDIIPDQGPLGGLLTAARIFQGCSLLTLTCDMPGVTLSPLQVLQQAHGQLTQATLFRVAESRQQPFPGIYDSSLCGLLESSIGEHRLSMREFLQKVPKVQRIPCEFEEKIFCNINRKADFEEWVRNADSEPLSTQRIGAET